jgi:hypothetical protein
MAQYAPARLALTAYALVALQTRTSSTATPTNDPSSDERQHSNKSISPQPVEATSETSLTDYPFTWFLAAKKQGPKRLVTY